MTATLRRALRPVTRPLKRAVWRAAVERDALRSRARPADLALFHDFAPPPAGGAHQALRAVLGVLEQRGVRVAVNVLPSSARACLFNSFNFDFERLEGRASRPTLDEMADGYLEVLGLDELVR